MSKKCINCGQEYTGNECANCKDPHRVPGISYEKATLKKLMVSIFQLEPNDEQAILTHIYRYPKAIQFYESSYGTFTLHIGLDIGNHTLGDLKIVKLKGFTSYNREIKCKKCENVVLVSKRQALIYALGIKRKYCGKCEQGAWLKVRAKEREEGETHLPAVGRPRQPVSLRSEAKRLWVSVNDFRRGITQPVNDYPLGKLIDENLEIIAKHWDDSPSVLGPYYVLRCRKCFCKFQSTPRKIDRLRHVCAPDARHMQ